MNVDCVKILSDILAESSSYRGINSKDVWLEENESAERQRNTLEQLLEDFHNAESFEQASLELKAFVISNGIPEEYNIYGSGTLRCRIWKLFLGVPVHYEVEDYIQKAEAS